MFAMQNEAAQDLEKFLDGQKFGTVLADPPWRFTNRTGKVAPDRGASCTMIGIETASDAAAKCSKIAASPAPRPTP